MDFIKDYVEYHSAYEIPRNYVYWSALGLITSVVHRKLHFHHGDINIVPNLYILLVGPQGNSKSTPCIFAERMFQIVCPDLETGAATQSAEDIVVTMAKDSFAKSYTDETGAQVLVSPYAFFIEEFKDFIAYAPVRMLNFLGNIYSKNPFKASTIKRGQENIINPCINILACENPEQLSGFMKSSIFTGGLSRRFILVYETEYADAKPFIEIPDDSPARQAWLRVKQRLIDTRKVVGKFQWADSGRKFYAPWYTKKHNSMSSITNQLFKGYVGTKHVQLFKVCMALDAVSDKPMLQFTDELLQHGLAFLDIIEPNMPKLSAASGRNEMAASYIKTLEALEREGGLMPERVLKKMLETDLSYFEIDNTLRHLEGTDQIIRKRMGIPNGTGKLVERDVVLLPKRFKEGIEKGEFKL